MEQPSPRTDQARTLSATITAMAALRADHVAIADEDGRSLSYGDLLRESRSLAAGLLGLGAAPGDRVVLLLDNHADHVVTWAALSFAGLVAVPINTAYQGKMLAQVLDDASAQIVICEQEHLELLDAADALAKFREVIVRGRTGTAPERSLDLARIAGEPAKLPEVHDKDLMQILFTSGTTGRSKGVLMTQAHLFTFCDPAPADSVTAADRTLVCLPLFHVAGQWCVYNALRAGATAVIARRFSASSFWRMADQNACTATLLLGVMADFLLKQPARGDDDATSVTHVRMVPVVPEIREFERRFGVVTSTYYGSTEAANVLNAPFGVTVPTGCGWPRDGVEVRLVDEYDHEVSAGQTGELILRASDPWELMLGYLDLPDETAAAYRNGWLHTGDLFRILDDGQYGFVDRVKDSLRRRGENVSSYEVEQEALSLAGMLDCAVVGVPSEHTEDEIYLTAVIGENGPDERAIWHYLAEHLPYFMVPRYIELLDALPRTASQKIGKADLRARGVARAWDASAEGLSVSRGGVRQAPRTR